MYKVSAREVGVYHHDRISDDTGAKLRNPDDTGVIVSIMPPINLIPEVVANYLTWQTLQDNESNQDGHEEVFCVQLLGSTQESTSIYAGVSREFIDESKQQLVENTIALIELLGSTATSAE